MSNSIHFLESKLHEAEDLLWMLQNLTNLRNIHKVCNQFKFHQILEEMNNLIHFIQVLLESNEAPSSEDIQHINVEFIKLNGAIDEIIECFLQHMSPQMKKEYLEAIPENIYNIS